jgi:hypothetical protein
MDEAGAQVEGAQVKYIRIKRLKIPPQGRGLSENETWISVGGGRGWLQSQSVIGRGFQMMHILNINGIEWEMRWMRWGFFGFEVRKNGGDRDLKNLKKVVAGI